VDGCPFAVTNQQWRSVFFDCPLTVKIDFQTRGKKINNKKKDETTKKTKTQTPPKKKKKKSCKIHLR
jgi:hypothetical protein